MTNEEIAERIVTDAREGKSPRPNWIAANLAYIADDMEYLDRVAIVVLPALVSGTLTQLVTPEKQAVVVTATYEFATLMLAQRRVVRQRLFDEKRKETK